MALSTAGKREIIDQYSLSTADTGSPEVQVALLTSRISGLESHFKQHKHDHHSRQGLLHMVSRRRSLLDHIRGKDINRYQQLISRLGLRR